MLKTLGLNTRPDRFKSSDTIFFISKQHSKISLLETDLDRFKSGSDLNSGKVPHQVLISRETLR